MSRHGVDPEKLSAVTEVTISVLAGVTEERLMVPLPKLEALAQTHISPGGEVVVSLNPDRSHVDIKVLHASSDNVKEGNLKQATRLAKHLLSSVSAAVGRKVVVEDLVDSIHAIVQFSEDISSAFEWRDTATPLINLLGRGLTD